MFYNFSSRQLNVIFTWHSEKKVNFVRTSLHINLPFVCKANFFIIVLCQLVYTIVIDEALAQLHHVFRFSVSQNYVCFFFQLLSEAC